MLRGIDYLALSSKNSLLLSLCARHQQPMLPNSLIQHAKYPMKHNSSPITEKFYSHAEKIVLERELLVNLKTYQTELVMLLESLSGHGYEDTVYRFYHESCKVYHAASHQTRQIVEVLRRLAPANTTLSPLFEEIYQIGTEDKTFQLEHNENWSQHTRPFIEAFFHARYFLEMAVKYGAMLDVAPSNLPSGWAALLCLYGIRWPKCRTSDCR